MKKLFSDRLKFKVMKEDPTLTLLKTVQKYVETIFKREESSEQKKKQQRPIAVQLGRAHRLPKMHKA